MIPRHSALVVLVAWSATAVACNDVNGQSQEQTMTRQQSAAYAVALHRNVLIGSAGTGTGSAAGGTRRRTCQGGDGDLPQP
jgi:hypothetical protein